MKRIKTLLFPLVVLLFTGCGAFGENYEAATFTVDGGQAIMEGVIDGTTPDRVDALINDHPDVITIVMQQVDGSADDEANIEAARMVRSHGFNTHVPADGEIASGGVDFFLSGVGRTVDAGAQLGVHSWAAGDGTTGADVPESDPQHKLYLDYYAEMGIPAEFYWFTLDAAPAESIHWMTPEEIEQYQFVTPP
ncbi:MAG: alpha/beta hydrolase [Chloroflexota bacterium]